MIFSLFGNYFAKPQVASADSNTPCGAETFDPTYSYSAPNYSFSLNPAAGGQFDGDLSAWTFQWSINTTPPTIIRSNATSFSGQITRISPGAYDVIVLATRSTTPAYSCYKTIPINIGTGASAAYTAQIDSATATSGPDSSGNYTYRLIAELDQLPTSNAYSSAGPTVISGGSAGVNGDKGNNGYNWTWTAAKQNSDQSFGSPAPISYNGTAQLGYNIQATFPIGTYAIVATATPIPPATGSPVSTPYNQPTIKYSVLTVGNAGNATISFTYTNGGSGFKYNLIATVTCQNKAGALVQGDCSSNYTYAWTVNGTALSGNGTNGFNVPATLIQGANTVSVIAKNNSDGSTIPSNNSLTLDANGNVLVSNGITVSTPSSSDACSSVSSAGITCIVGRVIGTLLGYIVQGITWLTTNLLLPITIAIIGIQVHTASFSAVIIQEWVFIRNFCNIFFIATLIIVGLGTLLQMSSYNLKSVLPRFVIAALLVNFSLAISQAILGVADTFQAQFLGSGGASPQSTIILQNLAYRLMVAPLANITSSSAAALTGVAAAVITEFIYFLIALVAVFVFVALTAFLVIRIIALWLLLMSSPIAYAASVVPIQSIKKASSQWWSNFLKYAFFTPIIALLLHICGLMADAQSTFTAGTITNFATNGVSSTQTLVTDILSAVLVAACMGASLAVAKSMGIKGADQVMKSFDNVQGKIFGAPKKLAGYGTDYAGGLANRWRRNLGGAMATDAQGNPRGGKFGLGRMGNMLLNPDAMLATTKANFEEKNKTAEDLANARAQRFSGFNQTGVDKRNDISAMQKKRDEKTSQFMNFDRDTLAKMQNQATDNETKMQILAARAQLGYLKRDATDSYPKNADGTDHNLTDDEFKNYSLQAIKDIPAGQQTAFLEQTFDKLGEKTKDLGLVGWGAKNKDDQQKAQLEKLASWSDDDMSNVKTGGAIKNNKELQAKFTQRIAKDEIADKISGKQLEGLSDGNLAQVIEKMKPASISKINPDKADFGAVSKGKILNIKDAEAIGKLPQKIKDAFQGEDRGKLVGLMDGKDAIKLNVEYIKGNSTATQAVADKITNNPDLIERAPKDMLREISSSIKDASVKQKIEIKLGTNSTTATTTATVNSPIVDSSGRPFSKDNPPRDSNPPRFTKTF